MIEVENAHKHGMVTGFRISDSVKKLAREFALSDSNFDSIKQNIRGFFAENLHETSVLNVQLNSFRKSNTRQMGATWPEAKVQSHVNDFLQSISAESFFIESKTIPRS